MKIAAHMRLKDYIPASILCSTARRTRETLDLLLSSWDARPQVRYEGALYLSDWPVLLDDIRSAPGDHSPLLVVGHNPGLQELAIRLARKPATPGERSRGEKLKEKFPTAALAVLDFDSARWREIVPGHAQLADYVRPADLGEGPRDG